VLLALIVLVSGTAVAAAIDVRARRIPNPLTASMAVAALALHAIAGPAALGVALAAMLASFALGTAAYAAGWFGGGDVKLLSAACGLASYPGCVTLVLFVLIAGAVLALAQAAGERRLGTLLRNAAALAYGGEAPVTGSLLPYGVAIAGGSAAYACSTFFPALRLPL